MPIDVEALETASGRALDSGDAIQKIVEVAAIIWNISDLASDKHGAQAVFSRFDQGSHVFYFYSLGPSSDLEAKVRCSDHGDVDECLDDQHARQARGKQPREEVASAPRDEKTAPGDHSEQPQHAEAADEPQLLANDGEDRVGMGVRHPVVLLQPVAQAAAKQAARTQGDQTLGGMPARALDITPWIEEGTQSIELVAAEVCEQRQTSTHAAHHQQRDVHEVCAPDEEHTARDGNDDGGGTKVWLHRNQCRDDADNDRERQQALEQLADDRSTPSEPVRQVQGHRQLGDLAEEHGLSGTLQGLLERTYSFQPAMVRLLLFEFQLFGGHVSD